MGINSTIYECDGKGVNFLKREPILSDKTHPENSQRNLNLLTPQNFPGQMENEGLCTMSWNWLGSSCLNVGLVLQHVLSSQLLGK